MTTAIATIQGDATIQQGAGFTREQKDLIKRSLFKDSTDDEFSYFIATAQRLRLDPFARQIFAVKRGGTTTIQVSIDGFRLVADRTGCYAPGRPTEYEMDGGKVVSATAYVKKLVAGAWQEVGESAYLAEYASGSSNPLWKSMPRVMLAKAAESRALRRAFPAELSGVYGSEEMDQANSPAPIEAEVVEPIDELAWQLRISAVDTIDGIKALREEFDDLPDTTAKVALRDLISKRRSAIARKYADDMNKGAADVG